jgi:O-antigen/teichoic acid export membrane protein
VKEPRYQRFSSGVAITFGARLLMAANSIVAGVLIARLLGADSLGIYLVLAASIQIVIQIGGFGLALANTYFTVREPEKIIPVSVNSVIFALISGGVCSFCVWLLADKLLPDVPSGLALVGLAVVPFQLITTYLQNLFLAQEQVKRFNFIDLLNQSFVLVNAVFALLIIGGGLWIFVSLNSLAGFVIAGFAAAAFYKYTSKRFPQKEWKPNFAIMPPMLSFSFKGFVYWACAFLVYRIDLMILNYFRGSAEAAVYGVATQCSMFLLPHAVSHLLQARVSATLDEGGEFTARVARHTSLLMFAACLASIPAVLVIAALYGRGFEELPLQLWILLPGLFFVGSQSILAQYFIGTGMHSFLSIAWLATLIANIALNLSIVPRFGAVGAAVSSSVCYTAVAVVIYLFFRKKTRFSIREILVPNLSEIKRLPSLLTS